MNGITISKDETLLAINGKMYNFLEYVGSGDAVYRCDRCTLKPQCERMLWSDDVIKCRSSYRKDGKLGYWVNKFKTKRVKVDNRSDEEKLIAEMLLS
jgi:hypothetical protein